MFVHFLFCVPDVFSLPKATFVQNVTTVTKLFVDLLKWCLIEAVEISKNMTPVEKVSRLQLMKM